MTSRAEFDPTSNAPNLFTRSTSDPLIGTSCGTPHA